MVSHYPTSVWKRKSTWGCQESQEDSFQKYAFKMDLSWKSFCYFPSKHCPKRSHWGREFQSIIRKAGLQLHTGFPFFWKMSSPWLGKDLMSVKYHKPKKEECSRVSGLVYDEYIGCMFIWWTKVRAQNGCPHLWGKAILLPQYAFVGVCRNLWQETTVHKLIRIHTNKCISKWWDGTTMESIVQGFGLLVASVLFCALLCIWDRWEGVLMILGLKYWLDFYLNDISAVSTF